MVREEVPLWYDADPAISHATKKAPLTSSTVLFTYLSSNSV